MTTHSITSNADRANGRRPPHILATAGTLTALGLIAAILLGRPGDVADRPASPITQSTQTAVAAAASNTGLPSHDYVVESEEEAGLLSQHLEANIDASGTPASATWRGTIRIAARAAVPPPYVVYLVATAVQQQAMEEAGLAERAAVLVAGSNAELAFAEAHIGVLDMHARLAPIVRDVRVADLRNPATACGVSDVCDTAP
jgi:PPE-repeat protein